MLGREGGLGGKGIVLSDLGDTGLFYSKKKALLMYSSKEGCASL